MKLVSIAVSLLLGFYTGIFSGRGRVHACVELCTRFKGTCSTTTPYTHAPDLLKSVDVVTINCMQQQQGILTQIEELMTYYLVKKDDVS